MLGLLLSFDVGSDGFCVGGVGYVSSAFICMWVLGMWDVGR